MIELKKFCKTMPKIRISGTIIGGAKSLKFDTKC